MRVASRSWLCFTALLVLSLVAADDPPDSELNPVTGYTESVDLDAASCVRHTEDRGQGGRSVEQVSVGPAANPRITITPSGNSWVAWWQDDATDGVYYSRRDLGSGAWGDDTLLSNPAENGARPEILVHAGQVWIVYEASTATSIDIDVAGITDEAEPIPNVATVATTVYPGDRDVRVHGEGGRLWVTWVDSATEVGWSEYDDASGTWSSSAYESYLLETVAQARIRIRDSVVNG